MYLSILTNVLNALFSVLSIFVFHWGIVGVASSVYQAYRQRTGDDTPTIIDSTASSYKSPRVAVEAVTGQTVADDFDAVAQLEQLSGVSIPKAVDGLQTAEVRHDKVVAVAEMQGAVEIYLNIN